MLCRWVFAFLLVASVVVSGQTPAFAQSSSRTSPIPFGRSAEIGDWTVAVTQVDFAGTDDVMAENQFNDPPAPGNQFVLATVVATYNGAETGSVLWGLTFKAVGDASVAYGESDPGCGVVPNDPMNAPELFTGGTVTTNICWSVPASDIDSLVMFVEPGFSFDNTRQFFALSASGADRNGVVRAERAPASGQTGTGSKPAARDNRPGGRDNPVQFGEAARVGEWTIQVDSVDRDAADVVLAENMFNDPPAAGDQFVLVTLTGRYEGQDSSQMWTDLIIKAVGSSNLAYSQSDANCGVIPDELYNVPEVFTGGVVHGNACWAVQSGEVDSLLLMVEPFSFGHDQPIFFELP